jgi:hypothetical protein
MWTHREVQAGIDAWGPRGLLAPDQARPALTIDDPEARAFVRAFTTHRVGLDHPADVADARAIFAALRERTAIDPRVIRAYVVREADKLAKIAAGRRG